MRRMSPFFWFNVNSGLLLNNFSQPVSVKILPEDVQESFCVVGKRFV